MTCDSTRDEVGMSKRKNKDVGAQKIERGGEDEADTERGSTWGRT